MLPLPHRLPLRGARRFFQTARVIRAFPLTAFWLPSTEKKSRGAVVIKKTVQLTSTRRSAMKRKLRALLLPRLKNARSPYDIVLMYAGNPKVSVEELQKYVNNIFAKLRD